MGDKEALVRRPTLFDEMNERFQEDLPGTSDATSNLIYFLKQLSASADLSSKVHDSYERSEKHFNPLPDREAIERISVAWGAVRKAVLHFFQVTPAKRLSYLYHDEHNPAIRETHIQNFLLAAFKSVETPACHRNEIHIIFDNLSQDPQFTSNLQNLINYVIENIFPKTWAHFQSSSNEHGAELLDSFHWRLQCWFLLRDALDSFLQPYWVKNTHAYNRVDVYQIIDDLLCQHALFSRILVNVRNAHAKFLNALRFRASREEEMDSKGSGVLLCAVQSFYYFLQLCGSKTVQNKSVIAYHFSQAYQFLPLLTRRLSDIKRDLRQEERGGDYDKGKLNVKWVEQIQLWKEAEDFIALHCFSNRNVVFYSLLNKLHHHLDSLLSMYKGSSLETSYAKMEITMGDPNSREMSCFFRFHRNVVHDVQIHNFHETVRHCISTEDDFGCEGQTFTKMPCPANSSLLYQAGRWMEAIDYLYPCMKQFEKELTERLWHLISRSGLPRKDAYIPLQTFFQEMLVGKTPGDRYVIEFMRGLAIVSKSLLSARQLDLFLVLIRATVLEEYLQGKLDRSMAEAFHQFLQVQGLQNNFFEEFSFNAHSSLPEGSMAWPDQLEDPLRERNETIGDLEFDALQRMSSRSVDEQDCFQSYIQLHNFKEAQNRTEEAPTFGTPTEILHLNSIVAIDAQTIGDEYCPHFLELPRDISMANKYTASYYRSLYPNRNISHIGDLSTIEISSSYFSESPDQPLSFIVNLYQACVLRFFEKYQSATLSQIVRHLIVDDITDEQYKQEKIRVRQALISLSSENAPLLFCEIGSEGHEIRFKLNEDWRTSKIEGLLGLYFDAYISSLDRKQERKIRGSVEKSILKRITRDRSSPQEIQIVIDHVLAARIHRRINEKYVRKCIQGLMNSLRIVEENGVLRLNTQFF